MAAVHSPVVDLGTHGHFDNGTLVHDFKQVFHYYPATRIFYPFEWERNFNGYRLSDHVASSMHIAFVSCVIYFFVIHGGQLLMRNQKPIKLRRLLAAWNLALSSFSVIGAIRTVPQLFANIANEGYHNSICRSAPEGYGFGACGLWVALFIYSKLPELGDTVFVVLRKKPVIFLHWYHHITVLLFCWHSFATRSSAGLYFVAMNFCVHSMMYFYYYLMAVDAKPDWLNPMFITIIQLVQMFTGMTVCASVFYYKYIVGEGDACSVRSDNLLFGVLIYGSYFALFFNFLLQRFVFKKTARKANVASTPADKKSVKAE